MAGRRKNDEDYFLDAASAVVGLDCEPTLVRAMAALLKAADTIRTEAGVTVDKNSPAHSALRAAFHHVVQAQSQLVRGPA